MMHPTSHSEANQLRELEQARCRAISELRLSELESILDDELTHTHVNGVIEDRDSYLLGLPGRPRHTVPGEMDVRILGDAAVMTGALVNTAAQGDGVPRSVEIQALRVWRRVDGGPWRLLAFAASGPLGGGGGRPR
jgi:hypothetical protein